MIDAGKAGFPSRASDLKKIKGIGDYTAGAIASIAFKEVGELCKSIDRSYKGNLSKVYYFRWCLWLTGMLLECLLD